MALLMVFMDKEKRLAEYGGECTVEEKVKAIHFLYIDMGKKMDMSAEVCRAP